jgi:hypothetical protein
MIVTYDRQNIFIIQATGLVLCFGQIFEEQAKKLPKGLKGL